MGIYLNPGQTQYQIARNGQIYIDKSLIISELNKVVNTPQRFICTSRPRRFGKTIDAHMIATFYSKTCKVHEDFSGLKILEKKEEIEEFANKFDVIFINMQEFLSDSSDIKRMISNLQKNVMWDLIHEYPDVSLFNKDDLIRSMKDIQAVTQRSFVVIIDEWDCIFREFREDKKAQEKYLDFLRAWLKDNPCIALVYMTGILPIKKYGTQSALNMFTEYSMVSPEVMAEYTGFTDTDVEKLCKKFDMNLEECKHWYDGYVFEKNIHIYNPKSIVTSMLSHTYDDYWNRTETYEALKLYIDINFDGLKDIILSLMAGEKRHIETGSFQNDMTTFANADDVLTLLVHLGYLGYDKSAKSVFIPNDEIMQEFVIATTAGNPWQEVANSVNESQKLLEATFAMDEASVAEGIEKAHFETSHIQYNDENALSYTISLAYYAARNYYTFFRELPAGKGFADMVFIPRKKYNEKPAMLIELKWDKDADTAIKQIYEKNYPTGLKDYLDNLLIVGINYDKKTKKHECKIVKYHVL